MGMGRGNLGTHTMDQDDQMVSLNVAASIFSHCVVVTKEVSVNGPDIDGEGHDACTGARGSAWQTSGPPLSFPPPTKSELLGLECCRASCVGSSSTC